MARPIPLPDPAWTTLGDAPRLLTDCGENPPEQRMWRGRDGEMRFDQFTATDPRVAALNAIWRTERDRLFEVARVTDRYSDFEAHCRLSVQSAVSAAVRVGKMERRAA